MSVIQLDIKISNVPLLKNGTLIEQGTHPSLMKKGGAYAKLWHIQTQINDE